MSDGLNGPTNEEARELLEIRLEEAQARHAEDLAKLAREMSEVVAQRDESRRAEREYDSLVDSVRTALCAPLSEFRRVLRVGDHESTIDAARRMSRELEVCLGQLEHVVAREKRTNLEAYALGRKSAEEHEGVRESERKELEAAPVGLPVATDEELWEVGDQAWYACTGNSTESRHAGALAVAARVRAERPTCLVERAVALGCDVRVCEDVAGWLVAIHESSDLDEDVHRDVAASDVPATLSRLLDEVEAARKAVQR